MKRTHTAMVFILWLFFVAQIQAQPRGKGGLITGTVVEDATRQSIEYAYVILFSQKDSTQAGGTVTESDGHFLLKGVRPGIYYLQVKYMGFLTYTAHDLHVGRRNRTIDLGAIPLREALHSTEQIEVEAEKPAMTYLIDKKIISVEQNQTTISGTAADVLENVPSVTVDIEGNVLLRGSSSYLVLIDNRPTILEPGEVLQQIPASTIQDIEIITNPSAKYDPDGTAGIINIITKKNALQGISGIVNANLGLDDKYGIDGLFEYRVGKANIFIAGDYNRYSFPGSREEEKRILFRDTTQFIQAAGSQNWQRERYSVRAGVDYALTAQNNLSFGIRYGDRNMARTSQLDYLQWKQPATDTTAYQSISDTKRGGPFLSVNADFQHRFEEKGHELSASVLYQRRTSDESALDELDDDVGQISSGRKTSEQGPSARWRFKLDYTRPLNKTDKIEAGYQSRLGASEDETAIFEYNPLTGSYELQSAFTSSTQYQRDIHALYGLYAGKLSAFGYQLGLRSEYTNRSITFTQSSRPFSLNRWDYFPTAHFSYQFTSTNQMMLSYTRRIERPRGYYFEPFLTWSDAYNVRKGNPDLQPEYINAYEMAYQTFVGRSMFSVEGYYHQTENKIERVRSVYQANVTLHTFENVGQSSNLGVELMINSDFFRIWNVNIMGNWYQYRIEGSLLGKDFSRHSFNWSTRFNNTLRLGAGTRLQLNMRYNSPTVSAQGSNEGYIVYSLGLRQEFFKKALSATLQVRDLFSTGKREFTSEGDGFYTHTLFTRKAPMVMLHVSYKIHNYQKKKRDRSMDSMDDSGDEEF